MTPELWYDTWYKVIVAVPSCIAGRTSFLILFSFEISNIKFRSVAWIAAAGGKVRGEMAPLNSNNLGEFQSLVHEILFTHSSGESAGGERNKVLNGGGTLRPGRRRRWRRRRTSPRKTNTADPLNMTINFRDDSIQFAIFFQLGWVPAKHQPKKKK